MRQDRALTGAAVLPARYVHVPGIRLKQWLFWYLNQMHFSGPATSGFTNGLRAVFLTHQNHSGCA